MDTICFISSRLKFTRMAFSYYLFVSPISVLIRDSKMVKYRKRRQYKFARFNEDGAVVISNG